MNDWTTKDLRKAAFAVGFGFTMGKAVAKFTNDWISEFGKVVCKTYLKWAAEKGIESSQEWCRKLKIDYESKETNDDEPKMKIGFC